jgi:hypothetical protein
MAYRPSATAAPSPAANSLTREVAVERVFLRHEGDRLLGDVLDDLHPLGYQHVDRVDVDALSEHVLDNVLIGPGGVFAFMTRGDEGQFDASGCERYLAGLAGQEVLFNVGDLAGSLESVVLGRVRAVLCIGGDANFPTIDRGGVEVVAQRRLRPWILSQPNRLTRIEISLLTARVARCTAPSFVGSGSTKPGVDSTHR